MHKGVSDIAAGGFIGGVALLFLPETIALEGVSAVLPQLLVFGMLLGSAYLIILGVVRKMKSGRAEEEGEPTSMSRICIIGAGSIAYVLAAPVLGFYVSSFTFLFIMATILLKHDGSKAKAAVLNFIFAVLMCLVVWGGFDVLLSVPTPPGILF